MTDETLKELRQEIREVDSELMHLVARRLRIVRKIGNLKQEMKLPIIDSATERTVIENYAKSARDARIDKDFANRLANLIIEASVDVQASMRSLTGHVEPIAWNVSVIGAGGMGSWFARFFKSRGSQVTVTDHDQRRSRRLASKIGAAWAPNNVEAVRGSEIIVLATPANVVSNVVNEILPWLKKNTLLIDISAVKSPVMPALLKAEKRRVQVASIHPLFGPLASGLREKNVAIIKIGKDARGSRRAKEMLENANILFTNQKEHDRLTAVTLALPHFLNMAFAMTISKHNLAKTKKFAGRTFDLQMLLAESVASEPETTADIQIMNKEFRVVLHDLERNIALLAGAVRRQERTNLLTRYRNIRKRLASDPEFALAGATFERVTQAASASPRKWH